jgi:trehalose utilization protein
MDADRRRVVVWSDDAVGATLRGEAARIHPRGVADTLCAALRDDLADPDLFATAGLHERDDGLPDWLLAETSALVWWGHGAHADVDDATVYRIHGHVLDGLGLVVLHSGHHSKIFRRLMGTSCDLAWRDNGEDDELIWTAEAGHPIAAGVERPIHLGRHEMYGEPFDIPPPDQVVFISSFSGGEVFRSGCCFQRGAGRIFYFSPGHETYRVYQHPQIRRVLANAVNWVRRRDETSDVVHGPVGRSAVGVAGQEVL